MRYNTYSLFTNGEVKLGHQVDGHITIRTLTALSSPAFDTTTGFEPMMHVCSDVIAHMLCVSSLRPYRHGRRDLEHGGKYNRGQQVRILLWQCCPIGRGAFWIVSYPSNKYNIELDLEKICIPSYITYL